MPKKRLLAALVGEVGKTLEEIPELNDLNPNPATDSQAGSDGGSDQSSEEDPELVAIVEGATVRSLERRVDHLKRKYDEAMRYQNYIVPHAERLAVQNAALTNRVNELYLSNQHLCAHNFAVATENAVLATQKAKLLARNAELERQLEALRESQPLQSSESHTAEEHSGSYVYHVLNSFWFPSPDCQQIPTGLGSDVDLQALSVHQLIPVDLGTDVGEQPLSEPQQIPADLGFDINLQAFSAEFQPYSEDDLFGTPSPSQLAPSETDSAALNLNDDLTLELIEILNQQGDSSAWTSYIPRMPSL